MRELTVKEKLKIAQWDNFAYCFMKRYYIVYDNKEYHIKVTKKDIVNYPNSEIVIEKKVKTLSALNNIIEKVLETIDL